MSTPTPTPGADEPRPLIDFLHDQRPLTKARRPRPPRTPCEEFARAAQDTEARCPAAAAALWRAAEFQAATEDDRLVCDLLAERCQALAARNSAIDIAGRNAFDVNHLSAECAVIGVDPTTTAGVAWSTLWRALADAYQAGVTAGESGDRLSAALGRSLVDVVDILDSYRANGTLPAADQAADQADDTEAPSNE